MIKSRNRKLEIEFPFIDPCYMKLQAVEVERKGVLVNETKFVNYDPREDYKDCKYRDFALENLIKLNSPLLRNEAYLTADQPDNVVNLFSNLNAQKDVQKEA